MVELNGEEVTTRALLRGVAIGLVVGVAFFLIYDTFIVPPLTDAITALADFTKHIGGIFIFLILLFWFQYRGSRD